MDQQLAAGSAASTKLDLRVRPRSVQQEVVDKLRQAILSGIFLPGNRLVETDLCNSLGVSRPSLREALRSLHAERLIEIIPNRGPHIPVLSWRDAEEIYEVRELLEGEAAARCAVMISEEELEALKDRLEAFRRAMKADDAAARISTASEFYAIILRNCGNKIIEEIECGLLARVNFLRARSMSLPGRAKKSYDEMYATFTAIKNRDPKEAHKVARRHVANARTAAMKAYQKSLRACPADCSAST
ncbi:MAG: GntR family transcriptional regulator [Pseudolabrys sp.]|nr:GntR family transcriptional regulator [Pseudolabrys sp.]